MERKSLGDKYLAAEDPAGDKLPACYLVERDDIFLERCHLSQPIFTGQLR